MQQMEPPYFLMKAPIAPPALCAAGQPDRWRLYKRHPQGNRRYILFNPIRAISDVTFLTFFEVLPPIWGLYPY